MENVSREICQQIATRGWFDATKVIERGRGRAQREPPVAEGLGSASKNGHFSQGNGRGASRNRLGRDSTRSKLRDRQDLQRYSEKGLQRDGS